MPLSLVLGLKSPRVTAAIIPSVNCEIQDTGAKRMLASPANRRKLYGLILMGLAIFAVFSFTGSNISSAVTRKPRIGLFMARGE